MSVEIRKKLESLLDLLNNSLINKYHINNQDKEEFDLDELRGEIEKFLVQLSAVSSNSLSKIYRDLKVIEMGESERRSLIGFLDLKRMSLDTFNREVLNQLNELNLEKFGSPLFVASNINNKSKVLKDAVNKVRVNRLTSKRFYENLDKELLDFSQSYIETNLKINNDFQYFVNDKKKEIEISISAFENSVKSISSKYAVASEDLDRIHKEVIDLNGYIKNNFDDIQVFHKKLAGLNSSFEHEILHIKNNLETRFKEIESKIYKESEAKLLQYIGQVDEVNRLMMDDFDSIKNTTMKFSEFMRDETSNKLTNDFKNKAFWEMLSYYGFTLLSFLIIIFAIKFSWDGLAEFTQAHVGANKSYTSLDLTYLSIRLIFSLIIFSSVAFTSRLASKSYVYWKKNEGVFLRLTALKSFIADMSESKKEEIHEKLVDVYFGKDEQDQNLNQKIKDLPNNITQLLGKVVDQTSVVLDASKAKEISEKTNSK